MALCLILETASKIDNTFWAGEHHKELALLFGTGNILHIPILAGSSFIEEAQGTIVAVCVGTADTSRDDIQEVLTYLLFIHAGRRLLKELLGRDADT